MGSVILALDQGTTSSRSILFDRRGQIVGSVQQEIGQSFPQPGWVEHDLLEIWTSQRETARQVLAQSGLSASDVHAIGITNQRETTALWDRATGEPVAPAIVWQCRRTAARCEAIRAAGDEPWLRKKTGLVADAYFSATKLEWLLESIPGARERAQRGELAFGTIDSWLAYRLSGGRLHITDPGNASRTMLFNIETGDWDEDLLAYFSIPRAVLPEIVPSSEIHGDSDPQVLGAPVPLAGIAGDQQAALFGQGCLEPGQLKNTYGTGGFMLVNTGAEPVHSDSGLLTSAGWMIGDRRTYILEGSVFIAGAAVQWLRDGLGIVTSADQTAAMAQAVDDSGGVHFVPAFVGLGAPYWDSEARGAITGLTRGTSREHIVRATLEAIAFQTRELMDTMQEDGGLKPPLLRIDGGAAANDFLCQFQADILGIPVERPTLLETTAAGAAYLAGLATGFWESPGEILALRRVDRLFEPGKNGEWRETQMQGWRKAVARVRL